MDLHEMSRELELQQVREAGRKARLQEEARRHNAAPERQAVSAPFTSYDEQEEMLQLLAVRSFLMHRLYAQLCQVLPGLRWNAVAFAVLTKGCLLELEAFTARRVQLREDTRRLQHWRITD